MQAIFPQLSPLDATIFQIDWISALNQKNYNLGLAGRYTLWDNGQREVSYAQAKEGLRATTNRNEGIKQSVILQITQAYYNVLKDTALVKVSEDILARSKENTEQTIALQEAGVLIKADIATARVS